MNLSKLEQKLNKQKARIGLVGGRLRVREVSDAEEAISAGIDKKDWHVEITIKEDYEPVRDEITRKYVEKRNISNPLEKICEDITYHECGHWELPRGSGKGCPYDEVKYDEVIESITKELERFDKGHMAEYVANAWADVLDNTNCKLHTSHSGQVLFFNEQGMSHGKYTKFYDAFVRLNLALWGEKIDNKFLKRWYTKEKKVFDAVRELLSKWNVSRKQDIEEKVEQLYHKDQWPLMAAQFARIMGPLLDEPQEHLLFGAAMQGKEQTDNGSSFDKKLDTREGQEKTAHARYKAGNGPATNRDSYEQLDALYRRLSRDIPLEIETFRKAYSYPLAPYGKEQFDPDVHDLLSRKAKLGIQEDGTIGLHVNKDWIKTQESYKLPP